MYPNFVGELNNYYSDLQCQTQMYMHKMSLEQIQDLANCIKVLGNALSFAENYSAMNGNTSKSEFTNYDYFYASKNTEKSLYYKKFAAAINNLDGIYDYYISKYRDEPLPKSLSKNDIITRLKTYKDFMKETSDKKLYEEFINLLSRKPINYVHNVVNNFKGDGTMNPNKISNTFLNAKGHVTQQNQEVAEQYNKDSTYQPDICMGADTPSIVQDNVGVSNVNSQNNRSGTKKHH
jgi:hypothetical protein